MCVIQQIMLGMCVVQQIVSGMCVIQQIMLGMCVIHQIMLGMCVYQHSTEYNCEIMVNKLIEFELSMFTAQHTDRVIPSACMAIYNNNSALESAFPMFITHLSIYCVSNIC